MTVEEFYEWCKEHNCTDYNIEVQFRDDGGYYPGRDEELYLDINDDKKIVIV